MSYVVSRCVKRRANLLDLGRRGQLERVSRVSAIRPDESVSNGTGPTDKKAAETEVTTHHSPRTVLANIPAPSCGIGSTSTRRELRTSSENAPRCVGEKADTTSVKSPSVCDIPR